MSQKNDKIHSYGMPPVGFGVVMPQPQSKANYRSSCTDMPQTAMPIQCASVIDGHNMMEKHLKYSSYNAGKEGSSANMESQQNTIQENLTKQRNFVEQKERLKEFSMRRKSKDNFTADAMIKNMFEKEQASKTSMFKPISSKERFSLPGCAVVSSSSIRPTIQQLGPYESSSNSNVQYFPRGSQIPNAYISNVSYMAQGFAAGCGVPASQNISAHGVPVGQDFPLGQNIPVGKAVSGQAIPIGQNIPVGQGFPSRQNTSTFISQPIPASTPNSSKPSTPFPQTTPGKKIPLQLPQWLTETAKLPEIYSKASSLVQSSDEWVDTKRAYLLLMQTKVPPQFLGILWETVNRSHVGQLTVTEFHALLALVACVQSGKSLMRPEDLISLEEPVYPLIDHPSFSSLVPPPSKPESEDISASHSPQSRRETLQCSPSNADEFDDFVSARTSPFEEINSSVSQSVGSLPTSSCNVGSLPTSSCNVGSAGQSSTGLHSNIPAVSISNSTPKNLPTLGLSPVNSKASIPDDDFDDFQKASINVDDNDEFDDFQKASTQADVDDFDDFQKAPSPPSSSLVNSDSLSISQTDAENQQIFKVDFKMMSQSPVNISSLLTNKEPNTPDKYSAFREFSQDQINEDSDGFGDFCSSEAKAEGTMPSLPTFSRTSSCLPSDFMGLKPSFTSNFEEKDNADYDQIILPSTYIGSSVHGDLPKVNDDFGDFVGSSSIKSLDHHSGIARDSCPSGHFGTTDVHFPRDHPGTTDGLFPTNSSSTPLEFSSETHSVASLELPELDAAIHLSSLEGSSTAAVPKSDEFVSSDDTRLEEGIQNLSIISHSDNDKYNIMREKQCKMDLMSAHIDLWTRCLEGCLKLLKEGAAVVAEFQRNPSLMDQVLATSQMKDYLENLKEVWYVSQRISESNKRNSFFDQSIQGLTDKIQMYWEDVAEVSKKTKDGISTQRSDSILSPSTATTDNRCSVCLSSGSVDLVYGGNSYHPPCANLWLNGVDLTLPSTLISRNGLL